MDAECIRLCDALNRLLGIQTVGSCYGHGVSPYRIFFTSSSVEALLPVLYHLDSCHCGFEGWQVTVGTDCAMSHVSFVVEGPIGLRAIQQAGKLAQLIHSYVAGQSPEEMKGLMAAKGWNKTCLEEATCLSMPTISNFLASRGKPHDGTIMAISFALNHPSNSPDVVRSDYHNAMQNIPNKLPELIEGLIRSRQGGRHDIENKGPALGH